jgi:hypothetical protein
MFSNLDIWRAANLARLPDLMVDRGDDEGRLVRVRIRRAIEALQGPPSSKPN